MNNSKLIGGMEIDEFSKEEIQGNMLVELEREINALEAISRSEYWKVIEVQILAPKLNLLRKQILDEKDEKELFRLQGKIQAREDMDFKKMLVLKRHQLAGLNRNHETKEN